MGSPEWRSLVSLVFCSAAFSDLFPHVLSHFPFAWTSVPTRPATHPPPLLHTPGRVPPRTMDSHPGLRTTLLQISNSNALFLVPSARREHREKIGTGRSRPKSRTRLGLRRAPFPL